MASAAPPGNVWVHDAIEARTSKIDTHGGYVDTITVDPGRHLVMPEGSLAHFANHSCDPTLWHATNSGDAGFTMDCTCGAMLCRGTITAQDWRRAELQERYDGHWIPALAALIGSSH